MALVNLKSKYKSLKFGSDQKGGGWSGQPFVTFSTDGVAQPGDIKTAGKSLIDFPKRGGDYPSNAIDFQRIRSFLETSQGKTFLEKQQTLQFLNPRIETGTSMKVSNNTMKLPGLVENTRVYSADNLLNQIKVQGTGGHVSRVGASNLAIQDDFYANTVGLQNITNSYALNRLAILHRLKISKANTNMFSSLDQFLGSVESTLAAKSLGVSTNQTLLFNYPGGPNSGNGAGNTTIGRYVDTTLAATINPLPGVMGYAQIAQQNAIEGGTVPIAGTGTDKNKITDFRLRSQTYESPSSDTSITWKNTMDETIGVANPGKIDKSRPQGKPTDYTTQWSNDTINSFYPALVKNDPYQDADILNKIGVTKTDIIKFGFECLSNDFPDRATVLFFRAFLVNGFSDNNSSNLSPFRYMGRGEEFFTYQGFSRQVSFSFKIAAFSRSELKPLYNKLNTLISQVYPDYSPNNNVMRAPLVKLTLGDYLYRVPGFIESVNVTVDNSSPWEVKLSKSENDVQQLPHVLEVSISFKPILSILPKRQTSDSVNLITNGFIQSTLLWGLQNAQETNIPNFGTIEA